MARLCPPGRFRRALDRLDTDFEGGLEDLEGLARTYAKDPDVRASLGMAYMDDERPFEALPHLEWAERKDPTPALQDALLATYLALDMPQHALRLAVRSGRLSRERGVDDEQPPKPDAVEGTILPTQDRLAFERARIGLLHGDPKAAAAMERLLAKHPGYRPARNLLVTSELLRGNIERYIEVAGDAFALAPDDPHALLNAARAAILQGGVEAARALRPHADALEPDAGWGGDRYLARAGALALMDDANATEAALGAYHHWVQESDDDGQDELADAIDDLLERRKLDPRAPLVDLAELVVGLPGRRKGQGEEGIWRNVEATLAAMPGLLHELPDWIGYQTPATVRLLALVLLHTGAPPPTGGSWATVFERVARHGPGTREARHTLLFLLAETGHIEDDEAVELDADTADDVGKSVQVRRFEISGEAVPTGLPAADEERMVAALVDLQGGRTAPALAALSALHERHPDSVPVAYNLAVAERLGGGAAVRRGHERLRRLVDRHPDYLFARADLALVAIDAGDLETAESLLALPEGKRRFHTLEWGAYAAANGRLALARGDADAAERFLDNIADALGPDAPSYRALAAALDDFDREHESDADAIDDDDDDDVVLPEVPDLDELGALPMREERWCIASRPAVFMIGEDPEPTLTWVGSVATDDGFVRLANVEAEPLDVDSLYALFARACAGGMVAAEPGRPRLVSMEDADLAAGLDKRLAALGIDVVQGDTEPALAAVHALTEALGGGVPAWLADAEDEHVEDFFDASMAFYDAMPWRRFESDRFLAFRVGDGPWRYANVMGQAGQEFGVAVYAGWREANAYVEDPGEDEDSAAERLAAIGWLEGLSLTELAALSPLDAARYLMADIEPDLAGQVPAWLRFEPDGPARPEHGPGVYAVLIDLLAEHAQRTKHRVRRIDAIASTPAGRMRVVYPATGEESECEARTPSARG